MTQMLLQVPTKEPKNHQPSHTIMSESSEMDVDAAVFVFPNFHLDNTEYMDTINTPQPLSYRNILLVNCDAGELGLSAKYEDSTGVAGNTVRIHMGPMTEAQKTIGTLSRAAEAVGIPQGEHEARTNQIQTLIYFMPVNIMLLHYIYRTPRVSSTEVLEIYVDDSFAMRIDKMYFLLLAIYSPFAPETMRKLKVHVAGEMQVIDLPNGPWALPSCFTTEVELWADYCATLLPEYSGTCISRLRITDPITPTMLRFSYQAHLTALLKTVEENAKWLTHLEISLAFSDSLFIILDACAGLKHLTSLTISECDPSLDQIFNPDDDFKDTFSHKLQILRFLKKLTIPDKLHRGYFAFWYPNLEVELVPDWDTQTQFMRAYLQSRKLNFSAN